MQNDAAPTTLGPPGDYYGSVAFAQGAAVGGFTHALAAVQLFDSTATPRSGDALLLTSPDLGLFSFAQWTLDFSDGTSLPRLASAITSLRLVPEPASFSVPALLAIAIGGLRVRRGYACVEAPGAQTMDGAIEANLRARRLTSFQVF